MADYSDDFTKISTKLYMTLANIALGLHVQTNLNGFVGR